MRRAQGGDGTAMPIVRKFRRRPALFTRSTHDGRGRMVTRTRSERVAFRRPFVLSGLDSLQPAGSYVVDTEEELLDALTVQAWKRISTVIQLARDGATEYLTVDPVELHEALMRDGAQPDHAAPSAHSPQSRLRSARSTMNAFRIRTSDTRRT
jgi:hypothetical protein